MNNMRKNALITGIVDQLPDMYLAELLQVSDFIKGLKSAREFMSPT